LVEHSDAPHVECLVGAILMAGAATLRDVPAEERASPAHFDIPLKGIGVRTSDDQIAENGTDTYRHRTTTPVSIADLDDEVAVIAGPAIYGGVMGPQFGHVISQSIGRLWVTERLPPKIPIVFANANPGFTQIPGYFFDFVRAMGIANPLTLVTRPTQIEELYLGPDLCNLQRRPTADPHYLDWLGRHLPAAELDPDLRLYISRSGIGPSYGQFLQERLLETALEAEGYRVIQPENLPLLEQMDLYRRAQKLVFADGSAVHLWSLLASADQQAAIILRRPWLRNFKFWFRSFNLVKVRILDRIVANFTGSGTAGRRPAALLDMQALWEDLREDGFHEGSAEIGVDSHALMGWLQHRGDGPFEWDEGSAILLKTRPHLQWVGAADVTKRGQD
jgi:hypothetical protein